MMSMRACVGLKSINETGVRTNLKHVEYELLKLVAVVGGSEHWLALLISVVDLLEGQVITASNV
jgi:hypothetical protein